MKCIGVLLRLCYIKKGNLFRVFLKQDPSNMQIGSRTTPCPLPALHILTCCPQGPPYAAASGSADGTVRLWDLVAGACVHKMRGLGGVVTLLTATGQFVIGSDQDDILCIWERNHGQLIHTIHNVSTSGRPLTFDC